MRIAFLGPPGAGKGTQVSMLSKEYSLPVLSTGDAFRSIMKREDELAEKVKSYVAKGVLVPDELVFDLVKEFIQDKESFILDGYPRNINQAQLLDDYLSTKGLALTGVINILLGEDEIVKRLTGRLVCPVCGTVYNIVYSPPSVEGVCDKCGAKLEKRVDDKEEIIRQRIKVYNQEMRPVLDYYRNKGILFDVDGSGRVEDVFHRIKEILKNG